MSYRVDKVAGRMYEHLPLPDDRGFVRRFADALPSFPRILAAWFFNSPSAMFVILISGFIAAVLWARNEVLDDVNRNEKMRQKAIYNNLQRIGLIVGICAMLSFLVGIYVAPGMIGQHLQEIIMTLPAADRVYNSYFGALLRPVYVPKK